MVFKKSFLFISLILAAILIQPAFAMDDAPQEKSSIHKWLTAGYKTLREMADTIDEIQGCDAPPPLPIQTSETLFFEGLLDEVTFHMALQLCQDPQALEGLESIALTCRKGYHLTQSSELWEPLKRTYFRHLPQQYIEVLVKGKKEQGFPLARILLKQVFSYQSEEIARLKRILSPRYSVPRMLGDPDSDEPILVYKLEADFKRKCRTTLEDKENLNRKQSCFEVYFAQEEMLDSINTHIIEECLKYIEIKKLQKNINGSVTKYRKAEIDFKGALTRLPLRGVDALIAEWNLKKIDKVELSLPHNSLRVLPDELFSSRLTHLDVRNNCLSYFPHAIKYAENLERLYFGNFKPLGGTCICCDAIGRRTTGNYFESIPSAILKLVNLHVLELCSVGLEEFSEEKIYGSLPELSSIVLRHNNLAIVPYSDFKGRTINVSSIGNPCHVRTVLDFDVWVYRYSTYCYAPLTRGLNHCIDTVRHHPYISGSLPLEIGLLLYYYGIISFDIPEGGF